MLKRVQDDRCRRRERQKTNERAKERKREEEDQGGGASEEEQIGGETRATSLFWYIFYRIVLCHLWVSGVGVRDRRVESPRDDSR